MLTMPADPVDSLLSDIDALEGCDGFPWDDSARWSPDLPTVPVLTARLDQCQQKGCDAVGPDNIDGYNNDTGFPLSAEDQLAFNRWLAGEAHARGLSIGLKNDPEQAAALADNLDVPVFVRRAVAHFVDNAGDESWTHLISAAQGAKDPAIAGGRRMGR